MVEWQVVQLLVWESNRECQEGAAAWQLKQRSEML